MKIINVGDFLTLDFGCVYNEYCSDMTRTMAIGKADKKMGKIYNIVSAAQEKALEAYRPDIAGSEVDKIARNVISDAGYGCEILSKSPKNLICI